MRTIDYFQSRIEATVSPMDCVMMSKSEPQNYILIDVRNAPPHLKEVKIKGALEIPLNELANRLGELPKDKMIIIYCWDVWCNMAAHAAVILLKNGYQVKELIGGISAWQSMNLPIEKL